MDSGLTCTFKQLGSWRGLQFCHRPEPRSGAHYRKPCLRVEKAAAAPSSAWEFWILTLVLLKIEKRMWGFTHNVGLSCCSFQKLEVVEKLHSGKTSVWRSFCSLSCLVYLLNLWFSRMSYFNFLWHLSSLHLSQYQTWCGCSLSTNQDKSLFF